MELPRNIAWPFAFVILAFATVNSAFAQKSPTIHQSSTNSNWMTAPQMCQGRPYSATAKAAHWKNADGMRGVIGTPADGAMKSSVLPYDGADFSVSFALQLMKASGCRITVGTATLDLSRSDSEIQISHEGEAYKTDSDDVSADWVRVKLTRWNGKSQVDVNEQQRIDLGTELKEVKQIGVVPTRGVIGLKHFVVTGNIFQQELPKSTEQPANR